VEPTQPGLVIEISKSAGVTIDHRVVSALPQAGDIAALHAVTAQVHALPNRGARAIVAIDASLTFDVAFPVLEAVAAGGMTSIGLAALEQGVPVMVPLRISPDPRNEPHAEVRRPPPLGLVLHVAAHELALWSTSGLEGTREKPRYKHPLDGNFAELTNVVADIAKRRFANQRHLDDNAIIVIVDPEQTAQVVLDTLAAVAVQFPDVQLRLGPFPRP
ncbi:MAG TPA: hypothetical protein VIV40_16725, partial [Kofleriaceae bacterium]